MTNDDARAALAKLREPFPLHHISKLPKESRAQTEERKNNRSAGVNCKVCGGWHHKNAVHLDYVGHAALTDRLLNTDPAWSWEPVSFGQDGLPMRDKDGGMWIRLTVCGVTRLGYGSADGKTGGDAVKELIGDALRNAAMRFGAALDLWHKGDLHTNEGAPGQEQLSAAEHRPALDPYPQERFKQNIEQWAALIQSGRKSSAEIVAMLETRAVLSDEQRAALFDLEPIESTAQEIAE